LKSQVKSTSGFRSIFKQKLVYKGTPLRANYNCKAIVECKKERFLYSIHTCICLYAYILYVCVCNTSHPRKKWRKYKIKVSSSTFIATILTKYGKLFLNFLCTIFLGNKVQIYVFAVNTYQNKAVLEVRFCSEFLTLLLW
jgi:hypothetical protein